MDPNKLEVNEIFNCFTQRYSNEMFTYYSGCKPVIEKKFIEINRLSDSLILIFCDHPKFQRTETILDSKVLILSGGVDKKVFLDSNTSLLVFEKEFFRELGCLFTTEGTYKCRHENTLKELFECLSWSEQRTHLIHAIGHIACLELMESKPLSEYEIIRSCICDNSVNTDFDLNMLCSKVFMSKRKVQYILQNQGTTFREVLLEYRSSRLKDIFFREPNISTIIAIEKAGIKNRFSANKLCQDFFGMSAYDLKKTFKRQ